jgi:hypothetical protein
MKYKDELDLVIMVVILGGSILLISMVMGAIWM